MALVLLILAVICAALATFSIATGRLNLLALAVLFYLLAVLVPAMNAAT